MLTKTRLMSGGKATELWLPGAWTACAYVGVTYRLRWLDGHRIGVRVRR